jgi:hypothetical protein
MKKLLLIAIIFCIGMVFFFSGVGVAKNPPPYVMKLMRQEVSTVGS